MRDSTHPSRPKSAAGPRIDVLAIGRMGDRHV